MSRWWLALMGVFGVAFACVTPPFQAPDEVGHYWRAVSLARGAVLPSMATGKPTALVPAGVKELVATLWVPTAGRPDLEVGVERLRAASRIPLQRERLVLVTFPAQYSPIPQLPTVIPCSVGLLLGVRPLLVLYIARCCNVAALILLLWLSARRLGEHAAPLIAVGLLPMTLYVAGSFSPDAVTIGVACLVTALVLTPSGDRSYWVTLLVAPFVLSLCKPTYFLLPLLVLCTARHKWKRNALLLSVIVAGVIAAGAIARRDYFPMRTDVMTSPAAQLRFVCAHPVTTLSVFTTDYLQHSLQYVDHFVGHLGWLDVPLPRPFVMLVFALLLCVAFTASPLMNWKTRCVAWLVVAASALLVSLSQYMAWTAVGAPFVEGMQGRYFLPLAPIAFASMTGVPVSPRVRQIVLVLFVTSAGLLDVIGVFVVLRRYYR